MDVNIGLWNTRPWMTGDVPAILDLVRLADSKGLWGISLPDHILMKYDLDPANYPYGKMPVSQAEAYFYEPLTMLAAMASVSERIRLTTHIVVAPLRSAVFFAKQVATLDVVANGRVSIGVGAGWQKEEFEASNLEWDNRFGLLDEQLRICKLLWSQSPATFEGKFTKFGPISAKPFPPQGADLPILFGVAPTPRQIQRIAELGRGWLPDPSICEAEVLAGHIGLIREAFKERGRDPAELQVGVRVKPLYRNEGDTLADLERTLAQIPGIEQAGATSVFLSAFHYCADESEFPGWMDRVVKVQTDGLQPEAA